MDRFPNINLIFGIKLPYGIHSTLRGFVFPAITTTTNDGTEVTFRNNQIGLMLDIHSLEKMWFFLHGGLGFDFISGAAGTRRTDTSSTTATYPGGLFNQTDVITSTSDVTWNLYSSSAYMTVGRTCGNFSPSFGTSLHFFGGRTHVLLTAEDRVTLNSLNNPLASRTQVVNARGEADGKPPRVELKLQPGFRWLIKRVSLGLYGEYGVVSGMLAASTVLRVSF